MNTNAESLKAAVCDYWEAEPCGIRYGAGDDRLAWFREISRTRYEQVPYLPAFARFPEAKGKQILEIGVGLGSDFLEWCRHAECATGVDLTQAAIGLVRERLRLEGIPDARYVLRTADAEALPFSDDSFDIVYSWGVLHHTPNTERAYREVFRVLKPGGQMRTMIYHRRSWTALMLYLLHGLAKGRPGLGLQGAVYHHLESPGTKAYTLGEARALAMSAGFADITATARLSPSDLLTTKPSARYAAGAFRLAWKLWPRPLIQALGDRHGLCLLLDGRKPVSAAPRERIAMGSSST
jgi:ubiquinone/menaquinone biosynthesis C-methylase UbiE